MSRRNSLPLTSEYPRRQSANGSAERVSPDITLLPVIAMYFSVSVDDLLGVGEIQKDNRIHEITDEYNRLRHHEPLDKNYRLDEGIGLIRKALLELPDVWFFKQLLASDLWWKGRSLCDSEKIFVSMKLMICAAI